MTERSRLSVSATISIGLRAMDERGIEPHVRVFDKSERTDGTYSRSDLCWLPFSKSIMLLCYVRGRAKLSRRVLRSGGAPAQAESFAAMRSATIIVVTFVATDGMSGRIDASTTRRASTPRTLPQASTTAVGSEPAPIGAVDVGCR
jgi:hypothetical protein